MTGIPGPSVSTARSELRTRVYYTYEVQEWRKGRTLSAEGADQGYVKWPDSPLEPGERVRSRKETLLGDVRGRGQAVRDDASRGGLARPHTRRHVPPRPGPARWPSRRWPRFRPDDGGRPGNRGRAAKISGSGE